MYASIFVFGTCTVDSMLLLSSGFFWVLLNVGVGLECLGVVFCLLVLLSSPNSFLLSMATFSSISLSSGCRVIFLLICCCFWF